MANPQHLQFIVSFSANEWNNWRKENPHIIPDLRDANVAGVDLSQFNLKKANLMGANLSQTNLTGTNLSKADLTSVKANNTDFCQAILTGVIIEDWEINYQTKFDNIIANHIFLSHQQKITIDNQIILNTANFLNMIMVNNKNIIEN